MNQHGWGGGQVIEDPLLLLGLLAPFYFYHVLVAQPRDAKKYRDECRARAVSALRKYLREGGK